jgi:hypothetical protein
MYNVMEFLMQHGYAALGLALMASLLSEVICSFASPIVKHVHPFVDDVSDDLAAELTKKMHWFWVLGHTVATDPPDASTLAASGPGSGVALLLSCASR